MLIYKMDSEQILMCIVALILGMLLANMLKNICGCKLMEGHPDELNGATGGRCFCSGVRPALAAAGDRLAHPCSREFEDNCRAYGGSYALDY